MIASSGRISDQVRPAGLVVCPAMRMVGRTRRDSFHEAGSALGFGHVTTSGLPGLSCYVGLVNDLSSGRSLCLLCLYLAGVCNGI